MGFWDLIKNLNNADGIREAMRMSYDKHFKLAQQPGNLASENQPHEVALFGALGTRLRLPEVAIWTELIPFMYLDPATGREALAEYVVYKERPLDAKIEWLKSAAKQGCQLAKNKGIDELITAAKFNNVDWLKLLES